MPAAFYTLFHHFLLQQQRKEDPVAKCIRRKKCGGTYKPICAFNAGTGQYGGERLPARRSPLGQRCGSAPALCSTLLPLLSMQNLVYGFLCPQ
jgi:hypothetical protein